VVSVGSLDNLLVDGQSLFDENGSVDLLVDDWLNFFDDSVDNGFVNDGSIGDSLAHSGGNLSSGEVAGSRSLGQKGRVVFDDDGSSLCGENSLSDFGGNDLSLSHGLDDFIDVELLSLSVDDGLDLNDFLSLVDLVNDGGLLDALDHGGSLSDINDRGLVGLDRANKAESLLAFQLIGNSVSVKVVVSSGSGGLTVSSLSLEVIGDSISVEVIGTSNNGGSAVSLQDIGDSVAVHV